VSGNGKVDIEQQVDHPACRMPVTEVRHGDAVEVNGVWQV